VSTPALDFQTPGSTGLIIIYRRMYLFFAFNFSTKGPTLTLDFLCMRSARRRAQSTGDMMIRADGGGGCGWMSEKKWMMRCGW